MPDQSAISHAARVLAAVDLGARADAALRDHLTQNRRLSPPEKRGIARAVFAYCRWRQWLDARSSPPQRLAAAMKLQSGFDADEKSVKPETLAVRAVPAWLWDELPPLDAPGKTAWLRQLQREPALWLRARPGTAATLAQ